MRNNTSKIFLGLIIVLAVVAAVSAAVWLRPIIGEIVRPPTPTPTPPPCFDVSRESRRLESTEPFVHLYAPEVNVTVGQRFSLNLAALNPIGTTGNLDITLILTVPSGISIYSSDFGTSVQGVITYTSTLNTGDIREIGMIMSAGAPPEDQSEENWKFTGQISWEVEGSDQSFDNCYQLDITVSHRPVELTFDLSKLPGDADVSVASPGACSKSESENDNCSLPHGKPQTLNINLNEEDYKFIRYEWEGNRPRDVNSKDTTIRLTENTKITPVVERIAVYTLSLHGDPEEAGGAKVESMDCDPSCKIRANQPFTIIAVGEPEQVFKVWESNDISIHAPNAERVEDLMLSGDTTITARFLRELTLTTEATEGGYVEVMEEVEGEGRNCAGGCVHLEDTRLKVLATANSGWQFVEWQYSGSEPMSLNNPNSATTHITFTENTTLTAVFKPEINLTITIEGQGTIISPRDCLDVCVHPKDANLDITAMASGGWQFVKWRPEKGSHPSHPTTRTTPITITEDTIITAVFKKAFILTLNESDGGALSAMPDCCAYIDGTEVGIIAEPKIGWEFVSMVIARGNDSNMLTSAETNITLTKDTTITATFERQPVTLTLSEDEGGTVSSSSCPNDVCEKKYGDVVDITASPDTDWAFVRWEYSGSKPMNATNPITHITLTEDTALTAIFKPERMLTVMTEGRGTITFPPGCLDGCIHPEDTTLEITAMAEDGWQFLKWRHEDGSSPLSPTVRTTPITITEDTTITAVFKEVFELTLNPSPSEGGTVSAMPDCCDYIDGTEVDLQAMPHEGYRFVSWQSVSGGIPNSSSNPASITITGDTTVTAIFERPPVTLTLSASEGGTVSPASCQNNGCVRNYGEEVNITASPSDGWDFVQWDPSGSEPNSLTNPTTHITLTEDTTLTAIFKPEWMLTIMKEGQGTISPSDCANGCVHLEGASVEINATADSGWQFVEWGYSGSEPDNVNSAGTDITLTEDTTLTAIFERPPVTLTLITGEGGTVSPSSCLDDGCEKEYGESVNITASPSDGWDFDKWVVESGSTPSGFDSDNEDHTITLYADVTLRLRFVEEPPCSGIPKMECDALVELYDDTDGENWTNNSGWLDGGDPNGWHGVRTSNDRVTEIYLPRNNLAGTLPSSIGHLTSLTKITLYDNNFSGELSPEIGNLTNLTLLQLGNNNFSGKLPPEIGGLTNLTELTLYVNNFNGELPAEIGDLVSLRRLWLWTNDFSGELPPEIGNLTNLTSLSLGGNNFSGELPSEIGGLTNLTGLQLGDNNFSGELPSEIGSLTNLTTLNLAGNNFSGELPPEIGNLVRLELLWLNANSFSGALPPQIGDLVRLEHLWLFDNSFSGKLPSEIGNLTNLSRIQISSNNFSGELPPEIGDLTNLTALSLFNNSFSGELPPEIGGLTNLTAITLYDNSFSGELPPEIGNLTNLTDLDLHGNDFSGELPPEIGDLAQLRTLWLSNNNLSGELPAEIGNLVSLKHLRLFDNGFSGKLPPEIGDLVSLTQLHLNNNNFGGELPTEIGDLTNLTSLYLQSNKFSGTVPPGVCDARDLDLRVDPQNVCP